LLGHAEEVAEVVSRKLRADGLDNEDASRNDLPQKLCALKTPPDDAADLPLTNSISPLLLHRTLVLLETLQELKNEKCLGHERLALGKALVFGVSNLEFGPEVGVGPSRRDVPVTDIWLRGIRAMVADIRRFRGLAGIRAVVHRADARKAPRMLDPNSIDAVITSPPYPNEKDYTRTTRLESVLLGFIRNKQDLRALKQDMVRSNTRGVYKSDRDDLLVADHDEVQRIADAIEERRIELGKTSGFERLYARVTKLYFGGMTRHLSDLRSLLRPGAQLAYVVGDQASYLRIMIRTGQLLAEIADSQGFEVVGIDLFRTRLATATREQLREEVVLLRWVGNKARTSKMSASNRYRSILEKIFDAKLKNGMREVDFEREKLIAAARDLQIEIPKNLRDLIYSFRYRAALPETIQSLAGKGETWIIRPTGLAKYRFVLVPDRPIAPNVNMITTKIPDATPGVVSKYSISDEQALLAKLRYNRLIDIFTGVACYSLQNHLRTTVPTMGQVESDEIYVGVDKREPTTFFLFRQRVARTN